MKYIQKFANTVKPEGELFNIYVYYLYLHLYIHYVYYRVFINTHRSKIVTNQIPILNEYYYFFFHIAWLCYYSITSEFTTHILFLKCRSPSLSLMQNELKMIVRIKNTSSWHDNFKTYDSFHFSFMYKT